LESPGSSFSIAFFFDPPLGHFAVVARFILVIQDDTTGTSTPARVAREDANRTRIAAQRSVKLG
jgi:hypothetical protein